MHLTTCPNPQALAEAVRANYKAHPFMAAVEFLGRYHLFASPTSTDDAAQEAATDFPKGTPAGQFEYLAPDIVRTLARPTDDLLAHLRNLGRLRTPR